MNRIALPVWRVCFGVHACTVRASFPICRLCEMCQLCICVHLSAYLPIHLWFSFFAFVLCLFCWLITRIMRQSCVRITIGHNVHMLLYAVAHNLIHMREQKNRNESIFVIPCVLHFDCSMWSQHLFYCGYETLLGPTYIIPNVLFLCGLFFHQQTNVHMRL